MTKLASPARVRTSALLAGLCSALLSGGALAAADITFADAKVFPESLTSTSDGTVYLGSISKGAVYRAAPNSGAATLWIDKAKGGFEGVFGVLADEGRDTLWVCSTGFAPPGSPPVPTALKSFSLKTAAATGSYAFPGAGFCNDIAVAKDGTTYVADTSGGRVLRLKAGAKALEEWSKDAKLASADGIALLDDGAVYVNGVQTNVLVRIPVGADGKAGAVVSLQTSRPLKGPDGMRTVGPYTMLLVEGNGATLSAVTISGDKAEIKLIKDGFTSPTAVTLVGDTAYVTEAHLNYLFDPALRDKDPGQFRAVAVPYPAK